MQLTVELFIDKCTTSALAPKGVILETLKIFYFGDRQTDSPTERQHLHFFLGSYLSQKYGEIFFKNILNEISLAESLDDFNVETLVFGVPSSFNSTRFIGAPSDIFHRIMLILKTTG